MIGERLTKLRKERKWTQEDISKRLNIPRSTYSNYENGKREPDFETTKMFAELFEVSTDYLLGTMDTKKHPAEKLREYLEDGLSNDEVKKRMDFFVEFMQLNDEQVDEFISFVRWKLDSKKEQAASSKHREP